MRCWIRYPWTNHACFHWSFHVGSTQRRNKKRRQGLRSESTIQCRRTFLKIIDNYSMFFIKINVQRNLNKQTSLEHRRQKHIIFVVRWMNSKAFKNTRYIRIYDGRKKHNFWVNVSWEFSHVINLFICEFSHCSFEPSNFIIKMSCDVEITYQRCLWISCESLFLWIENRTLRWKYFYCLSIPGKESTHPLEDNNF